MATIRKRGSKWEVQVRRKGFEPISRSFNLRSDAYEWARHIERQADRRELPADHRRLKDITVRNVLERYRDTVVTRKRAKEVETIIINAILRQPFVTLPLSDIKASDFSAYRDLRLRRVKPTTINRELGLIHHAFEFARIEWGIPLTTNPISSVRKPTVEGRRERRLQAGELERLKNACGKCRNRLIRPLVLLAIETAMRRGELLRLSWRDIDWNGRVLQIPVTKNGEPRTIPLTPNALAILSELQSSTETDQAVPLTAESVKLAWKRLTERAGIDDLHFHDLRHEAISRFFELGLSVPEVALISGHRDPRMLFRYTHMNAQLIAAKLNAPAEASNVVPFPLAPGKPVAEMG